MPADMDDQRHLTDRDRFLSDLDSLDHVDADLARSWRRSLETLGDPSRVADVPHVAEELLDAHLLDMFQAPLTRFSDSLDGTGLGVLLADADGQILQRWCSDRTSANHLDRIGTTRGAVLSEAVVGTNGVGTVAATGRGIQISGVQHFADIYRNAVCTGAPVLHPVSGKLLAVVTLSCELTPRMDLLRPLLATITGRLEQHVLEIEHPSSRRMFTTFLNLSRSQSEPVLGFGPQGLVVQNSHAARISSQDLYEIQQVCQDGYRTGKLRIQLSMGPVDLHVTEVGAGTTVAVVREQEAPLRPPQSGPAAPAATLLGRTPELLDAVQAVARHRDTRTPAIVAGEAGTGKLSLALGRPVVRGQHLTGRVVNGADVHVAGRQAWLTGVAEHLTSAQPLVIRGIETLDAASLDGLRALLEAPRPKASVLLTLTAQCREDAEAFALKYDAQTIWVPPLRDRMGDLPSLWRFFAEEHRPRALGLRPDTVDALRAYRWPGNLRELRTVIGQLALAGKAGIISPTDLPAAMQNARGLTMIERVELDAIRNALQEAQGNRARAAEILGLSRATVYRKMKAYRLTAE